MRQPSIQYPAQSQPLLSSFSATGNVSFFLINSTASGSNFLQLQVGGSAPSDATTSTGWTVGTTVSNRRSLMAAGVERAAATFVTDSPLPDTSGPNNTLGDCWRTERISASFAAGTWRISVPVIAVTSGGDQHGAMNFKLWRSSNADGSSATDITAALGTDQTSFALFLTTSTPQILTKDFTLGDVLLTNEYFFLQFGWNILGAGGSASRDVLIRVGQDAKLLTPGFAEAETDFAESPRFAAQLVRRRYVAVGY